LTFPCGLLGKRQSQMESSQENPPVHLTPLGYRAGLNTLLIKGGLIFPPFEKGG
jgi:hypothetical protein